MSGAFTYARKQTGHTVPFVGPLFQTGTGVSELYQVARVTQRFLDGCYMQIPSISGNHTTPACVQMCKYEGMSVTITLCCIQRTSPILEVLSIDGIVFHRSFESELPVSV